MSKSQMEKDRPLDKITVWGFKTEVGRFYIEKNEGVYDLSCNGEVIGCYATPQQAAKDIAFGGVLTTKTPAGKNHSRHNPLDIPADLDRWRVYFRHGATLYSFGYER